MCNYSVSLSLVTIVLCIFLLGGCSRWDPQQTEKEDLLVQATIAKFKKADTSMQNYFVT